jgi:hypothetical protein
MQYALSGARARLQELGRETQELFRHFPQLRAESPFAGWERERPRSAAVGTYGTAKPTSRRGRRRRMSKEARERIAAAQRKRWAEQRKRDRSKAAKSK